MHLPLPFSLPHLLTSNPKGAYAEFIVAPHRNLIKKPADLSWIDAASIPEVFLTGDFTASIRASGAVGRDQYCCLRRLSGKSPP